MPSEDSSHSSSPDFDPDKTLFFKRRQDKPKLMPVVVTGILVLGSGALIAWALGHPAKPPVEEVADAPYQTVHGPSMGSSLPPGATLTFDPAKPVRPALRPDTAPPAADVPATPDPGGPLNLDVKDPGNAQVRDDVLRRIDLMPGVSAANKDKLYASVDHARRMGRVLTIPFVKGESAIRSADVERLRQQLDSGPIREMTDDPTVVFVVLGYADPKGSDKVNADVSLSRARSVMDALRDRCGVQNVMHAVAMGGSTLFSAQQAEKNRVVEIWAVLP